MVYPKYPVIDTKATGERIRALRILNHFRVEDISRYMGFESDQAIYKWQRGESLPTVDNLFALSILFGVSIDDIIVPYKEYEIEGESPLLSFYPTNNNKKAS